MLVTVKIQQVVVQASKEQVALYTASTFYPWQNRQVSRFTVQLKVSLHVGDQKVHPQDPHSTQKTEKGGRRQERNV